MIGPTALGKDFGALTSKDNIIAQAFLEVLEPSKSRLVFLGMHFFLPEWLIRRFPIKTNAMLDKNQKILRGICNDIVVEKKQLMLAGEKSHIGDRPDLLTRIMETGEFSDSELIDQMLTFLAAGVRPSHTSSTLDEDSADTIVA